MYDCSVLNVVINFVLIFPFMSIKYFAKLQGGRCTLYSFDSDREFRAYFNQVLPVRPQQGDRVCFSYEIIFFDQNLLNFSFYNAYLKAKIIYGDDVGIHGTMVSVDNTEAVIKTDNNDIVLSHIDSLCRMENV